MNRVVLSVLFIIVVSLFSDSTIDIDLKIQQIQNASPQDRVLLMNEFKKTLRTMNNNNRIEAIKAIQAKQNLKDNRNNIKNNILEENLQQVQSISKQININEVIQSTNTGGF